MTTKTIKLIMLILVSVITLGFSSCSSMENDAKKVAKRAVEIEEVYKNLDDRSNLSGSLKSKEKEIKDYMEFANKMLEKYGQDIETRKKFNELVEKEIKQLKKN